MEDDEICLHISIGIADLVRIGELMARWEELHLRLNEKTSSFPSSFVSGSHSTLPAGSGEISFHINTS